MLSCIQFILLLRLRLWKIQTKGQHLNRDSMKDFILILHLLTSMNGARRAKVLRF